ncbi:MAG TPA: FeoA family protein [Fimbriimonadaceae bacterium]|nr:FeoA family protein [Fimbriimonadaceae bacterium]HRJ33013.1 FeoA family protein [Fimbriimonadaceae bacterium]
MTFRQLKKGHRARIVRFSGDLPHLQRLQEMGLTEGAEFEVMKVAPLGDPVEVQIRGYRLCLRKQETAGIEIELVP